jgi:probable addiction module antidote protein
MDVVLKKWDSATHLKDDEDIAAYLDACLQENDAALIVHALRVIAKAKNLPQASLPNEDNPALAAFFQAMNRLDIRLCVDHSHV